MRKLATTALMLLVVFTGTAFAQNVVEVEGDITESTTWNSENSYLLTGQTFVKNGATLTIEPGTVIESLSDDGSGLAPALVIERGAKIMADGTAENPITFTSALPDDELPQRGTWGGLIILGNAPIIGGENFVEGLTGVPYGGDDPNDSSGILRYVRVWYGGRSIGQDNEINGITLAGVGRGTTVEHCEIAYNLDDGFEMFGGTVDLRYCSVLFVGDDAFDTDEGYQGRGQFLFAMVGEEEGNRAHEMDSKFDQHPRSMPQFANVTLIGSGSGGDVASDNDDMIRLREGTAGKFWNYIIVDGSDQVLDIRDDETKALIGDSLLFSSNNIIFNTPTLFAEDYGITSVNDDPQLASLDGRESGGLIDPRPTIDGPAYQNIDTLPDDGFFTQVNYKGAFGSEQWLAGYSWLDAQGRLGKESVAIEDDVVSVPETFGLNGNYPNPFNPSTRIQFQLAQERLVEITIYNITGQQVRTIEAGHLSPGVHEVDWDGKNAEGFSAPAGVYLYRLNAGSKQAIGKMTLVK